MKKNYFLSALALGSMLLATSCSNDEPTGAQTGNGLTFTIQLPAEMGTRAFGDGSKAKDLYYAVYPAGANDHTAPLLTNFDTETEYHFTDVNTAITVTLDLVKNKEYNIFFYACDPGQEAFSYDTTERQLKVDYSKMTVNSEAFDVFCKYDNYTSNGGSHKVELTRPLAQINIGTDDLDKAAAAGLTVTTTGLKIAEAYTTMDVTDNSMVGTGAVVTIPSAAIPTGETFPVGDYKYLTMGYVLVPSDKSISDVTLNVNGDVWNTYTSVPMQMNFRTNIYGSLLTNKEVFNVKIEPAFEKPDYNIDVDIWDGSVEKPELDTTTNTMTIGTAAELAGFAQMVANGNNFSGKTITLETDIDLNNLGWTPIGSESKKFQGTFDGGGHTISNLNVVGGNDSYVGLIGYASEGEIKNLTINNASVSGYLGVGAVVGCPYTSKLSNITLTGLIQVEGFAYVGGVMGRNAYGTLTDITVNADPGSYVKANSVVNGKAYRTYVGGIVGFIGEGSKTLSNLNSNLDVIGSTIDAGGIAGIAHYGVTFVNCSSSGNVTLTDAQDEADAMEIGGIAGTWYSMDGANVTFTNCTFTGTLKSYVNGVLVTLPDQNSIVGAKYNSAGSDSNLIIN